MTNREKLLAEANEQLLQVIKAEEVILYGNTVVAPVIRTALEDLNTESPIRVFERGAFIDGQLCDSNKKRVVILCGMREKTRNSMRIDALTYFSDAICFDYFFIYYKWITEIVNRKCDYEKLASAILDVKDEHAVHNIDSINTTFCNLNCRECSNGMQFRREKSHVSIARNIQSLEKITEILPIAYCNIQGGEPFLDPNLSERIIAHAQNSQIAFLTLATNGTFVPNRKVMETMRECGVMLRISDYGHISIKKNELVELAKEYGVPCDAYHRAETWKAYGKLERHCRSESENKEVASNCFFGTKDLMLYDGDLYCCCRALSADAQGRHNDDVECNIVHLLDEKGVDMQQFFTVIEGKNLYRMCDYCDYPMADTIVAEQI